ncbi:TraA family conjugative transfer protein [Hydrogenophilus thermoluteolus]|uniref:TraA family conjugative transfer protein n=1 Tax=Hydrogenophilus thermoluteolus TaxID=297 RepID=UPI002552A9A7|nr:TraA family conjugative transfer protein [Hydrogenophilus thermoluteolus]
MKRSDLLQKIGLAVALGLVAGAAMAGTTGTEFQNLYNWVNNTVTGYFGKAISVAAVGVGAIMSIARVNPIPILAGVGFAVFLQYTPTIITGILTATI